MKRHDVQKGSPVWFSRPLVNVMDVARWAERAGVRKIMPADQIHLTLATVRVPVEWEDVPLLDDELVIESGLKPTQIFAYTIKALTFDDNEVARRHAEFLSLYPEMDHPRLGQHVSLYKGGRMPTVEYDGPLVFGPERAMAFDCDNAMGIKHVKVADMLYA